MQPPGRVLPVLRLEVHDRLLPDDDAEHVAVFAEERDGRDEGGTGGDRLEADDGVELDGDGGVVVEGRRRGAAEDEEVGAEEGDLRVEERSAGES